MFPQRNRGIPQQFQYVQGRQQYPEYLPQQRGLFEGTRQDVGRYMTPYTQIPRRFQHQQIPLQPQKQSMFTDEQGKLDFKKIGGGVQSAIGLINQVSPMMKMLGGFFK